MSDDIASRLLRNVRLIAHFNLFLGLRFHVAIAPVYFAHVTGSLTQASIILAAVFVSAAVFEIPTGVVSDRMGRRRTAVAAAIASVASISLYAVGTNFAVLFVGAILEGLRRALVSGNNEALLFESLREARAQQSYASHFGRTESLAEISLALCAPIGSLIAAWNLHAAVAIGIVPQLLCVLVALRLTEPIHRGEHVGNAFAHIGQAFQLFRKNPRLRMLTLSNALNYGLGEASFFFRPAVVATMWPLWAIGVTQLIGNVGTAVSSWFAGPVIERFGMLKGIIVSSVLQRVIAIVGLVKPTAVSPVLLGMVGFGYGVRNVGERTLLQQNFSDEQRATMGSLISLLGSIMLATALIGMGLIADAASPELAMLIGQVILILPTVFYMALAGKTLTSSNE